MNFPPKSLESNKSNKFFALNPNAAEFVPSSHRSSYGNTKSSDSSSVNSRGTSGISILSRSESSISNYSDEEAHQGGHHHLPNDLSPDFKAMEEDEQLSLAGSSIQGCMGTSTLSSSIANRTFGTWQGKSPLSAINLDLTGNLGYSSSTCSQDKSSAVTMALPTNSWGKKFINGDEQLVTYNGVSGAGSVNNILSNQASLEDALKLLASLFPGYSTKSLADMYYANEYDLNYTIKMLGQLEFQGDGGLTPNLNLDSLSVSNPSNGLSKHSRDMHQVPDTYRSTFGGYGRAADFVTALKGPPQNGIWWKNSFADASIGSSGKSQLLAGLYNGQGKSLYGDNSPNMAASRTAPVWLETRKAVANAYSGSREEGLDLARLRDVCLEQANQAYLLGKTALAKELSQKGYLYNMQMKAAQLKAEEMIYRRRNPLTHEFQNYNHGGQDCLIDLHGLHISDALHVLKHELNVLRSTARSSHQRLQATILLGSSHLSKGIQTPPRLPMAVEQCLSEEGLHYTQPQPGVLHVVIY